MQRLALLSIALPLLSTPAVSADLDGPVDRAPPVVERERIIERHHYYEPPPAYVERRVLVDEPDIYDEPRVYTYYDRPYAYAYAGWRPRHFFPRAHYWRRHHHRHW
jgi:hypothetical protein